MDGAPHVSAPGWTSGGAAAADPATVRAVLERVLASPTFANTGRLSRFLRFIVERTLDGQGEQLKEYVLGVEVFDRTEAFDPRLDSIVRVEARRLRARLDEYYSGEGASDPIVIRLPKGAYVPWFEPPTPHTPAAEPASAPEPPIPPAEEPAPHAAIARLVAVAIGLATLVGVGVGWTWRSTRLSAGPSVTVAVLPIVNYSGDPRQDTLAARLTDGIITELARVPALAVRSRTSVLQYKDARRPLREVARALDVAVIMEGGLVAEDGALKVDVRLVRASSDRKFWVDTFVGRQKDVRSLEQQIARAAAAAVLARESDPPQ
jgi:TolB-like protein